MPYSIFEVDDITSLTAALSAIADKSSADEVPNEALGNTAPYSEVYQRCARVMLKIVNHTGAKMILWDSAYYREYLLMVTEPLVFSTIATYLVQQKYGKDYANVAHAFYADVRRAIDACHTFYTEYQPFVAQSQKLGMAALRHSVQWLLRNGPEKMPVEKCTDQFCLMSGNAIKQGAGIKCGRCSGVFCLDALHVVKGEASLIKPTQAIVDKNTEEWVCLYCVREDSVSVFARDNQQPSYSCASARIRLCSSLCFEFLQRRAWTVCHCAMGTTPYSISRISITSAQSASYWMLY